MRRAFGALVVTLATLPLAACAGSAGGSDAVWTPRTAELPQEVHGVGTVLEADEDPMLCLGAIAESYPPQCGGPPVVGWDWAAVEGEESASGVTWGAYAVWGDWDGETFTVSREPVLAALDDPPADPSAPNPWDDGLPPGTLTEPEADQVRAELERAVPDLLGTGFVNGRLAVEVVFDDGTLQASVDERFGDDAVVIVSALSPSSAD